ncbi:helix-turn-helix transcriptional regulator [Ascidiaceihabitans sp.]|uniref:helix-turn-helix domain-containing protein n=1 Tax=Ascidiaceihabitans sp. TaxID=1872644 RepID=UPI00329A57CC
MSQRMEIATEAWGNCVPDWVCAIVKECDRVNSQNAVAKTIGYTGGAVSQIIRNKYPASTATMEKAVRAILMPTDVDCPSLGWIDTGKCFGWQKRAAQRVVSSSPVNLLMFRACRACARFDGETDE